MKCSHIQRRLLAAERPDQAGAEVQVHLADCAACRALQQRLLTIERDLTQLPVPESTRLAAFVGRFLQHTPVDLPAVEPALSPLVRLRRPASPKERGQRKLALTIALAASIAFVAFGMWALSPSRPAFVDPTNAHRIRLDVRYSTAQTPRARAEAALQVADDVCEDVKKLAEAPDADNRKMVALAQFYRELMNKHVKKDVADAPRGAERTVLVNAVQAHLQNTDSELMFLATTRGKAGEPLRDIALAARQTSAELNTLTE